MPRKGHKSITVREDVYNFFKAEYEKREAELRLKGIPSFSAFCTKLLHDMLELEKQRSQKESTV